MTMVSFDQSLSRKFFETFQGTSRFLSFSKIGSSWIKLWLSRSIERCNWPSGFKRTLEAWLIWYKSLIGKAFITFYLKYISKLWKMNQILCSFRNNNFFIFQKCMKKRLSSAKSNKRSSIILLPYAWFGFINESYFMQFSKLNSSFFQKCMKISVKLWICRFCREIRW